RRREQRLAPHAARSPQRQPARGESVSARVLGRGVERGRRTVAVDLSDCLLARRSVGALHLVAARVADAQRRRELGQDQPRPDAPRSPDDGAVGRTDHARHEQPGDLAPYIFRTHDFGRTWTKIVGGLGPTDYVHSVREDPARRGLLYAGTEHGFHISYDDGDHWQSLSLNLPDVQVSDIWVEANSI